MQIGEAWAYRARADDPLVEVKLLRIGVRKPPRVLVRFIDDEYEGLREWVPPGRLKTRWSCRADFIAREQRWTAVRSSPLIYQDPEYYAVVCVFDEVIDHAIATTGYNTLSGVSWIHDVDRLAQLIDVTADVLERHPTSFREDGALVVPWPITKQIALLAARRHPRRILECVEREEAEYQRRMLHGTSTTAPDGQALHVGSEYYGRALDDPLNRPCWQQLRAWCGVDAVVEHDELRAARRELVRLSGVVREAATLLRAAGRAREANRLERSIDSWDSDVAVKRPESERPRPSS
jgi:hypothetical protein